MVSFEYAYNQKTQLSYYMLQDDNYHFFVKTGPCAKYEISWNFGETY